MPRCFIYTIKFIKIHLVLILICSACATPPVPTPTRPVQVVSVSGASAMAPLLAALAEAFEQASPDVQIRIQTVNSAVGLAQVRQGHADLAAVAAEPPADLWRAPIALDGLALIVHIDNPLDTLTEAQAQALFGGRLWHWHDLGVTMAEDEITILSREEGSGDRMVFETLMKGLPVTPTAVLLFGAQAVVDFVATHPGAIGYVSQGMLSPQVKALRLEDVAPTRETVAQQRYRLIRPFFLVAVTEPDGPARAFVDFILGEQGQAIVARQYAPVRTKKP